MKEAPVPSPSLGEDPSMAAGPQSSRGDGGGVVDLHGLFLQGQKLYQQLEDSDLESSSPEYRQMVSKAQASIQEADRLARAVGAISSNEELEDIGTNDLKFILTNFYLGALELKVTDSSRLVHVERSKEYYRLFMSQCERLGILKGPDLKAWEAEVDEVDDEEPRPRGSGSSNAADARMVKIERFKREKEAKQKLRDLNYLLEKLDAEGDTLGEKEELERNVLLLVIEASIRRVLDDWNTLKQELTILAMMASRATPQEGPTPPLDRTSDSRLPQQRPPGPTMNVTHIDSVGGQLRIRQEEIRARVFQPGYNLPTMTLDEYATMEMRAAKEAEERSRNAPQPVKRYDQLVADGLEDEEELVDKATSKDRAWDDWKDDHPRGSGNKLGKRF